MPLTFTDLSGYTVRILIFAIPVMIILTNIIASLITRKMPYSRKMYIKGISIDLVTLVVLGVGLTCIEISRLAGIAEGKKDVGETLMPIYIIILVLMLINIFSLVSLIRKRNIIAFGESLYIPARLDSNVDDELYLYCNCEALDIGGKKEISQWLPPKIYRKINQQDNLWVRIYYDKSNHKKYYIDVGDIVCDKDDIL